MAEVIEKPREKLIAYGADELSDAELLALVLRTGYKGKNVLAWSVELIQRHGGLSGLATLGVADLIGKKKIEHGLGEAKAAVLLAVMEIGRRVAKDQTSRQSLHTPQAVASYLYPLFRGENQERFLLLSLDVRTCLLKTDTVFIGTIDHAIVHPREVFALALRRGAARIIVAHNHPSGDPTPSKDDEMITLRLNEAGKILGVELLDHVIIGNGCWSSLKERGVF
ncbi:MAG: DNA repair protein RadC [Symbiobacteriaceae bacterium]|nr:DNA repair protein RadC [Symbiobacteriaceae bacterium]